MYRFSGKLVHLVKTNPTFAILSVALTSLYLLLFVFQARVDISLEIDAPQASYFRIYWATSDQTFSEKRMAYVQVRAQQQDYHFRIASLGKIDRLRIDPIEYAGAVTLNTLRISQFGYASIKLEQASDYFPLIKQQLQITDAESSNRLQMQTTGKDGNLEITLKPERRWAFPLLKLLSLGVALAGLAMLMRLMRPVMTDLRFMPYLLVVSFALALTMALSTGLNLHPDEVVHLSAVKYYAGHLLPPLLSSPEITSSYSIYGHSRLSDFEIYYQLAGYFQAIPGWLNASSLVGARAFGLFIFALLIIFSFYQKKFRPFALPLLLSAQVWYLYSYTNSDGFALALAIFVAYLAASPTSLLNRFLTETRPEKYALKAVALGLLLGSLLLLKTNYYFFILFLGMYLLWRIGKGDFPDQPRLWKRVLLLSLIALSLYGARYVMDIAANGWDSASLQAQMQDLRAKPAFKPSTAMDAKHPMIDLKSRGHSLGYILVNARWFEKSFNSAFGAYGFSGFIGPKTYYDLVRYIGLLLLATLFLAIINSRKRENYALLLILSLCSSGLVAASIWTSWTAAFQAQGRYLLPILPMLGILYYHVREYALPTLVEWLSIILFLLAVYSFAFIGLSNMSSLAS